MQIAVRGAGGAVGGVHAIPDRRVGKLARLGREGDVVVRWLVGQFHRAGGEGIEDAGEVVAVDRFGGGGIDAEIGGFDRRCAAAEADVQAAAAELVEHADFLRQAQRMIERQGVDHRAEAQGFGALGDGGEEHVGRWRHAERGAVVFGQVVAVEAEAIVLFDDLQTVFEVIALVLGDVVEVVEDAEVHLGIPEGGKGKLFFLKKRTKKLLSVGVVARPVHPLQRIGVFWFFFAKKNILAFHWHSGTNSVAC